MPNRWTASAKIRQQQIESGIDLTFNKVFRPLIINHIQGFSPKNILEIGAGTGHLSKDLFNRGLNVTAIEPSLGMYNVAQEVLSSTKVRLINCTTLELEADDIYDMAFSHLVAHVVDDLPTFFKSINQHLTQNGHFIFSIPHPCFYNQYKGFFGDEYNYMVPMKKNVSFTITKDSKNVINNVPYYHRSLSEYINTLITSGFIINNFNEVYPSDKVQAMYGDRWEYPRYCLFICKKY